MKRLVVALAAIAALGLSLTACENKSTAAATIGSSTISESTLADYTTSTAKPYSETDSTSGQQYTVIPRHQALQVLIIVDLFDRAFAQHGGVPTTSAVDAEVDKDSTAAQRTALKTQFDGHGYTSKYYALYLEFQGKLRLLGTRLHDDGSSSAVVAALRALKDKVTVNPRYGTWDANNLALTERGAVPSFVTLSSASAQPAA